MAVSAILAAWIEFALVGLPSVPLVPQIYPNNFAGPHGFPRLLEDPWRLNPLTGNASSLHCDDRSLPSQDSLLEIGLLSWAQHPWLIGTVVPLAWQDFS